MQTGYVVLPRYTQTGSDALKKRFVVHALDDDDWTRRFLRNNPFANDWFKSLIGLIGLERDWWLLGCYVVRGFLSGRWIAFGQLTPRETKFHSDLNRNQCAHISGYENVLENVKVLIITLKPTSHN